MKADDALALLRTRRGRGLGLLLLVAIAITAALGGFRKAPASKASQMPRQPPGTAIDAGLFKVAADGAYLTRRAPGSHYDATGNSFLVVPVTVTNQGDSAYGVQGFLQQDLPLLRKGADGEVQTVPADMLQRAGDGGFAVVLNPRLRTGVLLVWKLPVAAPAPRDIQLGIIGRAYTAKAYTTLQSGWLQTGAAGIWRLPVADRRAVPATKP